MAILIFFLSGSAVGYLYMHMFAGNGKNGVPENAGTAINTPAEHEDLFTLRMYYPVGNSLKMVEKRLPKRTKQMSVAEAVTEEFLKGPENGDAANIPLNVKLLGLYRDAQQVLYIDLSDEFRRNFQGDAYAEYLLLKSFHESLVSNLQEFRDFKLLIEGKELESLGGHFYLKYSLNTIAAYDFRPESKGSGAQ